MMTADSVEEALARARRWRAKAEEIRSVEEQMSSEAARSSLDQMARNYESLAEHAERERLPIPGTRTRKRVEPESASKPAQIVQTRRNSIHE